MKLITLILSTLLYSGLSLAQTSDHIFLGALTVKGAQPYSYRIEFKDSANTFKGFSVTDLQGPDQTRTAIKGNIDPQKKEFSFKETKLITTRSKINRDSFCYIRAKMKMKERKGTTILSGTFTGYMKDGRTSCGSGDIMLVSKDDILDKLMAFGPKTDTLVKLIENVDAAATKIEPAPEPQKLGYLSIKPGNATTVNCKGNTATLELWDNNKIDGDVITLMHNETSLLSHLTLTNKKQQFTINLTGGTERIKLISEHEGSEPPTTARMSCTCGSMIYTIDASSAIGKPVEFIIQ